MILGGYLLCGCLDTWGIKTGRLQGSSRMLTKAVFERYVPCTGLLSTRNPCRIRKQQDPTSGRWHLPQSPSPPTEQVAQTVTRNS